MLRRHVKPLAKYGVVGILFTTVGPLFFLALALYLPRTVAILISEPVLYAGKFLIYRSWVYRSKTVNLQRYIVHVLPLYLASYLIVKVTEASLTALQAIAVVVIVNGVIGYFWGAFLYGKESNNTN